MGTLEMTLVRAQGIKDVDWLGKQDPYCIIKLGGHTFKSPTHQDGGSEPVWNQTSTWGYVQPTDKLEIELWDEEMLFKDKIIGTCSVPLAEAISKPKKPIDLSVPVITKKKHHGDLYVKLLYTHAPPPASAIKLNSPGSRDSTNANDQDDNAPVWIPGGQVLPNVSGADCWADWTKGSELGRGAYGTTYVCTNKKTGKRAAVKVISKLRMGEEKDVTDLRREVQILHYLTGHKHVTNLIATYEDKTEVCIVMEICEGGAMLDYIASKECFTEKDAATITRAVVSVIAHCHPFGVVHRDIKPENLLLSDTSPDAIIKLADFGVSTFFKEGVPLTARAGTSRFIAPEVLKRSYNKEADIWPCGVLLYLLLAGELPFDGVTQQKIFRDVEEKPIDLTTGVWTTRSEQAKDCVSRMLQRDISKGATADEILQHPWLRENGCARDSPMEFEVVNRIQRYSGMSKLKKEALKVIACQLPLDEVIGFQAMFQEMDKDGSGCITVEEFKHALERKGQLMSEAQTAQLLKQMDTNGDGVIDYEEFLGAMIHAAHAAHEDRLRSAFEQFDTDASGSISLKELEDALRQCKLSDEEIQDVLREADQNGDGEIDVQEFVSLVTRDEQRPLTPAKSPGKSIFKEA